MSAAVNVLRMLDSGERDALGNMIVNGCPFPSWCRFKPGPLHRHSIIPVARTYYVWEAEGQTYIQTDPAVWVFLGDEPSRARRRPAHRDSPLLPEGVHCPLCPHLGDGCCAACPP